MLFTFSALHIQMHCTHLPCERILIEWNTIVFTQNSFMKFVWMKRDDCGSNFRNTPVLKIQHLKQRNSCKMKLFLRITWTVMTHWMMGIAVNDAVSLRCHDDAHQNLLKIQPNQVQWRYFHDSRTLCKTERKIWNAYNRYQFAYKMNLSSTYCRLEHNFILIQK